MIICISYCFYICFNILGPSSGLRAQNGGDQGLGPARAQGQAWARAHFGPQSRAQTYNKKNKS